MLTNISVKNLKCFEKFSLELKNLNLFSGINSMGKSTLIQALLLLRQASEQDALEKGIYLNGKYTTIGSGKELLYYNASENYISISLESEDVKQEFTYCYKGEADFLEREKLEGFDFLDEKRNGLFGIGFAYIAADRLGPQSSYHKSYYEVWEHDRLGIHGEYAVHYLAAHENDRVANKSVLYPGEENTRLLRQVECWMGEITPGISFRKEDYGHSNLIGLTVHQASTVEAEYFSIPNVGFGISYAFPIVLALVKAKPGDLVILENPEAHLHPKGQRKIGELIAHAAAGGVQIIVETHSDHILNGIRLAVKKEVIEPDKVNLVYFTRRTMIENGNLKIYPFVEQPQIRIDGRLSFWPDGFFDEWDKAIDEMF